MKGERREAKYEVLRDEGETFCSIGWIGFVGCSMVRVVNIVVSVVAGKICLSQGSQSVKMFSCHTKQIAYNAPKGRSITQAGLNMGKS